MKLAVVPMELDDIPQVLEIDRESYTTPWPASAYRREILHNRNARYVVLRDVASDELQRDEDDRGRHVLSFLRWPLRAPDGQADSRRDTVGYAGMWLMIDEAHITTIAVRSAWRGRGLGELLLINLIERARELGVERMTLEVRVTNEAAQSLYRKYGFEQAGVRPRYYSDNNEDAYVMTTGNIQDPSYRRTFSHLGNLLAGRLETADDFDVITDPSQLARSRETVRETE